MTRVFDIFTNDIFFNSDNTFYANHEDAFKDVVKGDKKRLMSYKGSFTHFRDYANNSLLHTAVSTENVDLVKYFLELKLDPYYRNKANKSSWDLALRSQNREIVKLFSDCESAYKEQNERLNLTNNGLKIENKNLENRNLDLTRKCNTFETENSILKLHNKRFRDDNDILTTENNELKESNKKLKTSVDNMAKTFRK